MMKEHRWGLTIILGPVVLLLLTGIAVNVVGSCRRAGPPPSDASRSAGDVRSK